MTALDALIGARVQRVDLPAPDLLCLELSLGGVLVIGLSRSARGLGLSATRPRGDAASPFVRKLRIELVGARIEALRPLGRAALHVDLTRGPERVGLAIEWLGEPGNVLLLDGEGHVVVALHARATRTTPDVPGVPLLPTTIAELEHAGEALLVAHALAQRTAQRTELLRETRRALEKLERKRAKIASDAERAREAPALRHTASLLLSALHAVPRGAARHTLLDPSTDPPHELVVDFDGKAPSAYADALFKRARKLDTGARIAAERAAACDLERDRLLALHARLDSVDPSVPESTAALVTLHREADRLGVRPRPPSARGPRAREAPRVPFRTFVGAHDRELRVGRGAADNDALTLHHARPSDLWLHARGVPGAHVVVPLAKNEACPPELLVDAAHLAAHFSDARGERLVEVTYAPKRFVRKPRGSAVGAVQVDREKVLPLRLEPDRLARLLAAEKR